MISLIRDVSRTVRGYFGVPLLDWDGANPSLDPADEYQNNKMLFRKVHL